jgi:hypothetical protein
MYVVEEIADEQNDRHLSFRGGLPRIPADLQMPVCTLCKSLQTFYFQVAFPEGHPWNAWSLAVFACTECGPKGELVPAQPPTRLKGANIAAPFYKKFQKNFRLLPFRTGDGVRRTDYEPRVAFKNWQLVQAASGSKEQILIGGRPRWVSEDETPATYAGSEPLKFLMQMPLEYEFPRLKDAPLQVLPGITGKPERKNRDHYWLFVQNALYFFGTQKPELDVVFVVTQRD